MKILRLIIPLLISANAMHAAAACPPESEATNTASSKIPQWAISLYAQTPKKISNKEYFKPIFEQFAQSLECATPKDLQLTSKQQKSLVGHKKDCLNIAMINEVENWIEHYWHHWVANGLDKTNKSTYHAQIKDCLKDFQKPAFTCTKTDNSIDFILDREGLIIHLDSYIKNRIIELKKQQLTLKAQTDLEQKHFNTRQKCLQDLEQQHCKIQKESLKTFASEINAVHRFLQMYQNTETLAKETILAKEAIIIAELAKPQSTMRLMKSVRNSEQQTDDSYLQEISIAPCSHNSVSSYQPSLDRSSSAEDEESLPQLPVQKVVSQGRRPHPYPWGNPFYGKTNDEVKKIGQGVIKMTASKYQRLTNAQLPEMLDQRFKERYRHNPYNAQNPFQAVKAHVSLRPKPKQTPKGPGSGSQST